MIDTFEAVVKSAVAIVSDQTSRRLHVFHYNVRKVSGDRGALMTLTSCYWRFIFRLRCMTSHLTGSPATPLTYWKKKSVLNRKGHQFFFNFFLVASTYITSNISCGLRQFGILHWHNLRDVTIMSPTSNSPIPHSSAFVLAEISVRAPGKVFI